MKKILISGVGGPAGINFVNSLRDAKEKMYLIGADTNSFHLEWPNVDEKVLMHKHVIKNINNIEADLIHPQLF